MSPSLKIDSAAARVPERIGVEMEERQKETKRNSKNREGSSGSELGELLVRAKQGPLSQLVTAEFVFLLG